MNIQRVLGIFLLFLGHALSLQAQSGLLQSGPMLGYSDMREVALWVQTKAAAKVKFAYWEKGKKDGKKFTEELLTQKQNAFTATLPAELLEPGLQYEYELYINNKVEKLPYPLEFRTQPIWRWRGDAPDFKFAIGSCIYVNDPPYDRPGKPYGSNFEIFDAIHAQKPDFMLWLGDNTYLREPDWNTRSGIFYRYTHSRSLPSLQKLLAATPHYAIWDDHDFGPNDSDGSFALKHVAEEAFKSFWANPNYGVAAEGKGITGTFEWADVQFFLLDDRYFRTANRNPADDRAMIGKAQRDWLINALAASTATFKIVAIGGQAMSPVAEKENWATYPEEQKAVIEGIKKAKIEGVLFLSGDRHFTELTKRVEEGFYPLYDFTSSPLTSGAGSPGKSENNTFRVPNTLVGNQQNFGIIEVKGTQKERKLILHTLDKDGKEVWKHEISRKELSLP